MKKFLWTLSSGLAMSLLLLGSLPPSVSASTRNATYEQEDYLWYDNDGGLNAATGWGSPDTAINTNIVDIPNDNATVFRLRLSIRQTLNNANAQLTMQPQLQFSTSASCTSGTWTNVPISTTTTQAFRQASTAAFTDGTATTQQDNDGHSFLSSGDGVVGTGTPNSVNFTTTTSQHAEFEWAIVATTNAAANTSYHFRAFNATASGAFSAYTNCPGLTTLPAFNLTQNHYRWRNDDGSETTATWSDNSDTSHPNQQIGTNIRVRYSISNTGTQEDSRDYRLQYAVKSGSCGTYNDVPVTPGGSDPVEMTTTTNYTDQSATTNVAGGVTDGSGVFLAGKSVEDPSVEASSFTLTHGDFTELEFNIAFTSQAPNLTTYCFRVTRSGIAFNTYTNTAEITVSIGPTTDQLLRGGQYFDPVGGKQPFFWAN
jgi:hypothetical protein